MSLDNSWESYTGKEGEGGEPLFWNTLCNVFFWGRIIIEWHDILRKQPVQRPEQNRVDRQRYLAAAGSICSYIMANTRIKANMFIFNKKIVYTSRFVRVILARGPC